MSCWAGVCWTALAISFSRKYNVIGYDIDTKRIADLEKGLITQKKQIMKN